jgi:hypothetical protein
MIIYLPAILRSELYTELLHDSRMTGIFFLYKQQTYGLGGYANGIKMGISTRKSPNMISGNGEEKTITE